LQHSAPSEQQSDAAVSAGCASERSAPAAAVVQQPLNDVQAFTPPVPARATPTTTARPPSNFVNMKDLHGIELSRESSARGARPTSDRGAHAGMSGAGRRAG
jgi:hypothetical protein